MSDYKNEKRKTISIRWCIEDIKNICPDITDEQAWDLLQEYREKYDCTKDWEVFQMMAEAKGYSVREPYSDDE